MKHVVIIGAGPAGLTAGLELLRKSNEYTVTVLESSDTVGGISRTVNVNGNRMDIGGHRFFSKDESVNRWWNSLLAEQGAPSVDDIITDTHKELSGTADPEKEDKVFLKRRRVSRIYFRRKFFDYPISMKPQTFINMGFMSTVKSCVSYAASVFHKRDENNLENFYINRFGKELYSMFFESYTQKLWGRHPSEISADWGAQRVKGLSVKALIADAFKKLVGKGASETSLIEEFHYPKFGPGQLWQCAADEFCRRGGKIFFGTHVDRVITDGGRVCALECEKNGKREKIEGDIFISSMPVKDLINGMDGCPEEVREIANGLPYRDFVTVGLLLDRLAIKNTTRIKTVNDRVPDCWIYVQDKGVRLGRIQIFNNWSPYMVKDFENTVFIGLEYFCTEGDGFWSSSDEELKSIALSELEKIGVTDSPTTFDFHVERVKKAYPAYFDSYDRLPRVIDYLNGLGNLYCIGRNGQHRYNNMDHSMVTAFRAVDCILSGDGDKSKIWNVNTEKEYHEDNGKA